MRNGILACPACGGEYLHQTEVSVYRPVKHDSSDAGALHRLAGVALDDDGYLDTMVMVTGGPRRSELAIRFSCEGCSATPTLTIEQYKGQTLVEWREPVYGPHDEGKSA